MRGVGVITMYARLWPSQPASSGSAIPAASGCLGPCWSKRNCPTKWSSTPGPAASSSARLAGPGRVGPRLHDPCTSVGKMSFSMRPARHASTKTTGRGSPCPPPSRGGSPCSPRPDHGQRDPQDAALRHRLARRAQSPSPYRNRRPVDDRRPGVSLAGGLPFPASSRVRRAGPAANGGHRPPHQAPGPALAGDSCGRPSRASGDVRRVRPAIAPSLQP